MSSFVSASQPVRSSSRPVMAGRRLSWDGDESVPVRFIHSSPSSRASSVVHSSSQEVKIAHDNELTPPKSGDENDYRLPATYELILTTINGSNDKIKAIPLVEKQAVTLGRRGSTEHPSQNDGAIGCPVMSKRHAEIVLEYGEVYLSDLESMHGTFLNNEKLTTARRRVKDGDSLTFGKDVDKRGQVHPALRVEVSLIKINSHLSRPPSYNSGSTGVLFAVPTVSAQSSPATSPVRSPLPGGRSASPEAAVVLGRDEVKPHRGLFQFTTADELGPDSPKEDGPSSPLNAPTSIAAITERFSRWNDVEIEEIAPEDNFDIPFDGGDVLGGHLSDAPWLKDLRVSSPDIDAIPAPASVARIEDEPEEVKVDLPAPPAWAKTADRVWTPHVPYRGGVFDLILNHDENPTGPQKPSTSGVDMFVKSRSASFASSGADRRGLGPLNVGRQGSDDEAPSETEIQFGGRPSDRDASVRKEKALKDRLKLKLKLDSRQRPGPPIRALPRANPEREIDAEDWVLGGTEDVEDTWIQKSAPSPPPFAPIEFARKLSGSASPGKTAALNPVLKRRERLQRKIRVMSRSTGPASVQQSIDRIASMPDYSDEGEDVAIAIEFGNPYVTLEADVSGDAISRDEHDDPIASESASDEDMPVRVVSGSEGDEDSEDAMVLDGSDDGESSRSSEDSSSKASDEELLDDDDDVEDETDPIANFSDGEGPASVSMAPIMLDLVSDSESDADSSLSDAESSSDDSVIAIDAPPASTKKHLPILSYFSNNRATSAGPSSPARNIVVSKVEPVEDVVVPKAEVLELALPLPREVRPKSSQVLADALSLTGQDHADEEEPMNAAKASEDKEPEPAASADASKVKMIGEQIEGVNEKVHELEQHVQKCTDMLSSSLGKRKRIEEEIEEPVVASASTQTLAAPAQVQSAVQTTPAVGDAPTMVAQEPVKKKARSGLGTFLLGALAGSVATVGALAAYGWNEEMAMETGTGW